jgi:hypothetical protein
MRRLSILWIFAAVACSSSSETPPTSQADTGTTPDVSNLETSTGGDYLDPIAGGDAPPSGLPDPKAFDGAADVDADLSCAGMKMPVGTTPTDHEIHTIEIGGKDANRVGEIELEVFYANKLGTPDATGTSSKGTMPSDTGVVTMKVPTGFVTFRAKGKTGYLETIGYDYFVEEGKGFFVQTSPIGTIQATEILSTEPGFEHAAGTTRFVAQVTDCKRRPISGVFVTMESDGKVVVPTKSSPGARRNFFGDNSLPSDAAYTTRSGVVAIVDLPVGAKMRAVGWVKKGGSLTPIVSRSAVLPADVVVTALVTPFASP